MTLEAARVMLDEKFAPWVQELAFQIEEIGRDGVRLRLPYHPRLTRSAGMICGQALMAIADSAMGFAVAARHGQFVDMVTVGQTISFLRTAGPVDIICEVRLLRVGRTLAFGEATLTGADRPAEPVAKASITYALVPSSPSKP